MIISVASGKGGTGKTTVAVNLALSLNSLNGGIQFMDCDVDEPNAFLFLKPRIDETRRVCVKVPEVDESKCNFCGTCAEICAYNALAVLKDGVLTFPALCHGCGGCSLLCPEKAIREVPKEIGVIDIGLSREMQFLMGRMNVGEVMSAHLIREVRKLTDREKVVIVDAPPGTSCPVIASVKESDFCILVSEPTPFGLYDMELMVEVLKKLEITFGVVINRSTIGDDCLETYCRKNGIPVLMRIPYDGEISYLYSRGLPIVNRKNEYIGEFQKLFEKVVEIA